MGTFLKVYNKKILWAPLVCWASDTQPCAQRQDLCPMGTLMISGGRHIFPKYWKWFWCKFWEKKWGSVKGTRNCPKDFVLILAIQNVVAGENLMVTNLNWEKKKVGTNHENLWAKNVLGEGNNAKPWGGNVLDCSRNCDQRGQSTVSKGKEVEATTAITSPWPQGLGQGQGGRWTFTLKGMEISGG